MAAAAVDVVCDAQCFSEIKAGATQAHANVHQHQQPAEYANKNDFKVRDLWQKADVGLCVDCSRAGYTVTGVPRNGAVLLKFTRA